MTGTANIVESAAVGETAMAVFFAAPTATDETSPANPAVACDHNSGDMFPIGPTTVTCIATDDAGNTPMESFSIFVIETPPTPAEPEAVEFIAGGGTFLLGEIYEV